MRAGIRGAFGVALAICFAPACASVAVLDGWKASGIPTTVKLDAPERQPDRVELQWSARAQLPYSPERVFQFDPELSSCERIEVWATGSDQVALADPRDLVLSGFGRDVLDGSADAWRAIGDSRCSVLLVVGSHDRQAEPRLHVSTANEELGTVKLETERNHWWLPLFPLGVAVDLTGVPIVLGVASCLAPVESNLCIAILTDL